MNWLLQAFQLTCLEAICFVLPFVLFALMLHAIGRWVQVRLARRFGWPSVMLTGWIGTPIHELSHAVLCKVFAHRINKIALFEPDIETGVLGYVQHSYDPQNRVQSAGNFFIAIAPLVGGLCSLYGMLWIFFPEAAGKTFAVAAEDAREEWSGVVSIAALVASHVLDVLRSLVTPERLTDWRLWLFLYLSLCVGAHMAPSMTDYRSVRWFPVLGSFTLAMLAANCLVLASGGSFASVWKVLSNVFIPALALCTLALALVAMSSLVVYAVTELYDGFRGR